MDSLDVNVLVYAYRTEALRHRDFRAYLDSLVNGAEPFAVPAIVFSGFLRVVTNPKVFTLPSPVEKAIDLVDRIHSQPHCITVVGGARHMEIFLRLCKAGGARGSLVADAYLAAMAMEIGAELVTADRGFGRWPGLRWRHPLDE